MIFEADEKEKDKDEIKNSKITNKETENILEIKKIDEFCQFDMNDVFVQLNKKASENVEQKYENISILNSAFLNDSGKEETSEFSGGGDHIIFAYAKNEDVLNNSQEFQKLCFDAIKEYVSWFNGPDIASKISEKDLYAKIVPIEKNEKNENNKESSENEEKELSSNPKESLKIEIKKNLFSLLFEDAENPSEEKSDDNKENKNINSYLDKNEKVIGYFISYEINFGKNKKSTVEKAWKKIAKSSFKSLLHYLGGITISWGYFNNTSGSATLGDLINSLRPGSFIKIDANKFPERIKEQFKLKFPDYNNFEVKIIDTKSAISHLKKRIPSSWITKINQKNIKYAVAIKIGKDNKSYKLISQQEIADLLTKAVGTKTIGKVINPNRIKAKDIILINNYNEENVQNLEKSEITTHDESQILNSILTLLFEDTNFLINESNQDKLRINDIKEQIVNPIETEKIKIDKTIIQQNLKNNGIYRKIKNSLDTEQNNINKNYHDILEIFFNGDYSLATVDGTEVIKDNEKVEGILNEIYSINTKTELNNWLDTIKEKWNNFKKTFLNIKKTNESFISEAQLTKAKKAKKAEKQKEKRAKEAAKKSKLTFEQKLQHKIDRKRENLKERLNLIKFTRIQHLLFYILKDAILPLNEDKKVEPEKIVKVVFKDIDPETEKEIKDIKPEEILNKEDNLDTIKYPEPPKHEGYKFERWDIEKDDLIKQATDYFNSEEKSETEKNSEEKPEPENPETKKESINFTNNLLNLLFENSLLNEENPKKSDTEEKENKEKSDTEEKQFVIKPIFSKVEDEKSDTDVKKRVKVVFKDIDPETEKEIKDIKPEETFNKENINKIEYPTPPEHEGYKFERWDIEKDDLIKQATDYFNSEEKSESEKSGEETKSEENSETKKESINITNNLLNLLFENSLLNEENPKKSDTEEKEKKEKSDIEEKQFIIKPIFSKVEDEKQDGEKIQIVFKQEFIETTGNKNEKILDDSQYIKTDDIKNNKIPPIEFPKVEKDNDEIDGYWTVPKNKFEETLKKKYETEKDLKDFNITYKLLNFKSQNTGWDLYLIPLKHLTYDTSEIDKNNALTKKDFEKNQNAN